VFRTFNFCYGASRKSLIIFSLKFIFESFVGKLGYMVAGRYFEVFVDLHFGKVGWDPFLYVELSG
jgi:hypothetical protein